MSSVLFDFDFFVCPDWLPLRLTANDSLSLVFVPFHSTFIYVYQRASVFSLLDASSRQANYVYFVFCWNDRSTRSAYILSTCDRRRWNVLWIHDAMSFDIQFPLSKLHHESHRIKYTRGSRSNKRKQKQNKKRINESISIFIQNRFHWWDFRWSTSSIGPTSNHIGMCIDAVLQWRTNKNSSAKLHVIVHCLLSDGGFHAIDFQIEMAIIVADTDGDRRPLQKLILTFQSKWVI